MTVGELQKAYLSSSSEVRIAPEDFFVLLSEATGKDKAYLFAHPEYALDVETEARVKEYFARRLKREPIAYIVGHKEFYGLDFRVTKATLIPRPETELLVELTLDKISNVQFPCLAGPLRQSYSEASRQAISQKITVIDIGTGSGNIIISLAKTLSPSLHIPHSTFQFFAADISQDALEVAKENARQHDADDVISFHHGNLLAPFLKKDFSDARVIITANLPYLSEEIYQGAEDDVKTFEPRSALVSDKFGLSHSFRLLDQLHALSTLSLDVYCEISPEQSIPLLARIHAFFPRADTEVIRDLAGTDRIVHLSLQ